MDSPTPHGQHTVTHRSASGARGEGAVAGDPLGPPTSCAAGASWATAAGEARSVLPWLALPLLLDEGAGGGALSTLMGLLPLLPLLLVLLVEGACTLPTSVCEGAPSWTPSLVGLASVCRPFSFSWMRASWI